MNDYRKYLMNFRNRLYDTIHPSVYGHTWFDHWDAMVLLNIQKSVNRIDIEFFINKILCHTVTE